ncbi:MAG TPA: (Fe-S)-binding protein [Gaiellaceae bacterium]|nr:(Fe-S)-binding protein [Gaiellaceae bacterium]
MRVGLFVTCLGDTLFPEAPQAVVRVLERLGHDVEFPTEQTCCGQLHGNSGYRDEAFKLAERFERIFEGFDAIVSPSSSCVGMIREYRPTLAPRVFEFSEFLVSRLGVVDVDAHFRHRVTYHPTCHSLRVAKVGDAPLRLLRAVRGLELVELPHATECCGFGGTFAVKNAETSTAMLAAKCSAILSTGAQVCTAVDNSCLLQISGGLARGRSGVRTMHLAEILAS